MTRAEGFEGEPPRPQFCDQEPCRSKGYVLDSFACKIRHLALHTGAAKAANDFRKDEA